MSADRIYAPRGSVAHLRANEAATITACGLYRPEGWWGTGTQDEYEEAARRPLCRLCRERSNLAPTKEAPCPTARTASDAAPRSPRS